MLLGVLVQRFALQETSRKQQQDVKESKPVKAKAKAKTKAAAKEKATRGRGRKPKVNPDSPKESKHRKGKENAKKKNKAADVEEVTPKALEKNGKRKGNPNRKNKAKKGEEVKAQTPMKRPAQHVSGSKTKHRRPTTASDQVGIVNPSNPDKRTFARRAEPKNQVSKVWWASLYKAFDEVVRPKVKAPSTLEDRVGVVVFQQV